MPLNRASGLGSFFRKNPLEEKVDAAVKKDERLQKTYVLPVVYENLSPLDQIRVLNQVKPEGYDKELFDELSAVFKEDAAKLEKNIIENIGRANLSSELQEFADVFLLCKENNLVVGVSVKKVLTARIIDNIEKASSNDDRLKQFNVLLHINAGHAPVAQALLIMKTSGITIPNDVKTQLKEMFSKALKAEIEKIPNHTSKMYIKGDEHSNDTLVSYQTILGIAKAEIETIAILKEAKDTEVFDKKLLDEYEADVEGKRDRIIKDINTGFNDLEREARWLKGEGEKTFAQKNFLGIKEIKAMEDAIHALIELNGPYKNISENFNRLLKLCNDEVPNDLRLEVQAFVKSIVTSENSNFAFSAKEDKEKLGEIESILNKISYLKDIDGPIDGDLKAIRSTLEGQRNEINKHLTNIAEKDKHDRAKYAAEILDPLRTELQFLQEQAKTDNKILTTKDTVKLTDLKDKVDGFLFEVEEINILKLKGLENIEQFSQRWAKAGDEVRKLVNFTGSKEQLIALQKDINSLVASQKDLQDQLQKEIEKKTAVETAIIERIEALGFVAGVVGKPGVNDIKGKVFEIEEDIEKTLDTNFIPVANKKLNDKIKELNKKIDLAGSGFPRIKTAKQERLDAEAEHLELKRKKEEDARKVARVSEFKDIKKEIQKTEGNITAVADGKGLTASKIDELISEVKNVVIRVEKYNGNAKGDEDRIAVPDAWLERNINVLKDDFERKQREAVEKDALEKKKEEKKKAAEERVKNTAENSRRAQTKKLLDPLLDKFKGAELTTPNIDSFKKAFRSLGEADQKLVAHAVHKAPIKQITAEFLSAIATSPKNALLEVEKLLNIEKEAKRLDAEQTTKEKAEKDIVGAKEKRIRVEVAEIDKRLDILEGRVSDLKAGKRNKSTGSLDNPNELKTACDTLLKNSRGLDPDDLRITKLKELFGTIENLIEKDNLLKETKAKEDKANVMLNPLERRLATLRRDGNFDAQGKLLPAKNDELKNLNKAILAINESDVAVLKEGKGRLDALKKEVGKIQAQQLKVIEGLEKHKSDLKNKKQEEIGKKVNRRQNVEDLLTNLEGRLEGIKKRIGSNGKSNLLGEPKELEILKTEVGAIKPNQLLILRDDGKKRFEALKEGITTLEKGQNELRAAEQELKKQEQEERVRKEQEEKVKQDQELKQRIEQERKAEEVLAKGTAEKLLSGLEISLKTIKDEIGIDGKIKVLSNPAALKELREAIEKVKESQVAVLGDGGKEHLIALKTEIKTLENGQNELLASEQKLKEQAQKEQEEKVKQEKELKEKLEREQKLSDEQQKKEQEEKLKRETLERQVREQKIEQERKAAEELAKSNAEKLLRGLENSLKTIKDEIGDDGKTKVLSNSETLKNLKKDVEETQVVLLGERGKERLALLKEGIITLEKGQNELLAAEQQRKEQEAIQRLALVKEKELKVAVELEQVKEARERVVIKMTQLSPRSQVDIINKRLSELEKINVTGTPLNQEQCAQLAFLKEWAQKGELKASLDRVSAIAKHVDLEKLDIDALRSETDRNNKEYQILKDKQDKLEKETSAAIEKYKQQRFAEESDKRTEKRKIELAKAEEKKKELDIRLGNLQPSSSTFIPPLPVATFNVTQKTDEIGKGKTQFVTPFYDPKVEGIANFNTQLKALEDKKFTVTELVNEAAIKGLEALLDISKKLNIDDLRGFSDRWGKLNNDLFEKTQAAKSFRDSILQIENYKNHIGEINNLGVADVESAINKLKGMEAKVREAKKYLKDVEGFEHADDLFYNNFNTVTDALDVRKNELKKVVESLELQVENADNPELKPVDVAIEGEGAGLSFGPPEGSGPRPSAIGAAREAKTIQDRIAQLIEAIQPSIDQVNKSEDASKYSKIAEFKEVGGVYKADIKFKEPGKDFSCIVGSNGKAVSYEITGSPADYSEMVASAIRDIEKNIKFKPLPITPHGTLEEMAKLIVAIEKADPDRKLIKIERVRIGPKGTPPTALDNGVYPAAIQAEIDKIRNVPPPVPEPAGGAHKF